ncbi:MULTISPECIES: phosphoribosyltransferase [unclassified Acinetobacter]|uniref:phosphoribosyltransferase n=1 Tax=unclassified Acinetobacter TaxID=196816 RepID=UPI00039B8C9B|nr:MULTISPECIES: phosphoribosyltransferase [unclassified Acinetobacter]NWK83052.1 phosphoribosyltransferase [Acinetobacter sp. SwsAc4]
MKYPIEIENKLIEIEKIINCWSIKKDLNEVVTWMLQFDNEDFDIAFRIIKNLNIIGPEELNSALSIAYSKLNRQAKNKGISLSLKNTMYASIGGGAKSGAMIAYNFRLINELASANFLDAENIRYLEEGKVENLVLVDDFIGTGDQASQELKEIAERVFALGVKNIFVLTAIGFKSGIKKVQETELADVFSALEFDEKDTVKSLDSIFYEGLTFATRKSYFEKLSKYRGLGYGGIGALLAFYYNTPNATINCICGDSNGWIPLIPRVSNINGIDKLYPKLEQAATAKHPQALQNTLNIYVEGKSVELFIELIGNEHNKLGYEKFEVISVGPFYSEKLIASLKQLSTHYIFITEKEDENSPHFRRISEVIDHENLIIMDEMINFFDLPKIIESKEFVLPSDEQDIDSIKRFLEIRLFRRVSPSTRQDNINRLYKDFRDESKILSLISEIKQKSKKL